MNTAENRSTKFTIDDARRLWQGTISEDTSPEMSIKPESAAQVSDSYSNLVIRPKQVSVPSQDDITGSDLEILKQLGEGGMGVVYRAKQASIDREVAVKMLHAEAAQGGQTPVGMKVEQHSSLTWTSQEKLPGLSCPRLSLNKLNTKHGGKK